MNLDHATPWLDLLQTWARELGFSQIGVADVDLSSAEPGLLAWLAAGFHGEMDYMARHGLRRARPAELLPGTVRVITARMDYLPRATLPGWQAIEWARLARGDQGVVSQYARGRDYHKVLRTRLQRLADRLQDELNRRSAQGAAAAVAGSDLAPGSHAAGLASPEREPSGFAARAFTDSAPVLEVELASRSGLGWRGKHTLTLSREAGSMFFLGEVYVNVPLPLTAPVDAHCGSCDACLQVCPTQAIVAPYQLDARRCLSYLSIEHAGPIPVALRTAMGSRVYGCDDCQTVCPWNKFAQASRLPDFDVRPALVDRPLTEWLAWTEAEFLHHTEGSPIRRIGHERWQRNVAVALGNRVATLTASSPQDDATRTELTHSLSALRSALPTTTPLVAEHVHWALSRQVV